MTPRATKKQVNKPSGVSVIIPAYNVESCLSRAVLSALEQVPPPLEVIVINDGSTDRTAEVARGFGERIRYLEQPNQGQGAARNAGLAVAAGEYVAFLDADDCWLPGFFNATSDFFRSHPEAVAVSTGWKIYQHDDQVITFPSPESPKNIPDKALILDDFFSFWGKFDHIRTGTILIRHSIIKKAGYQQPHLRISQDLEYWGYIATNGPWGFIPEIYWFGDSARIAAQDGWLSKYRLRRNLCPTVEAWQQRILPNLKDVDWPGFRMVRGRVASNYAHSMILAGRFRGARKIIKDYGVELPKNRITQLMKLGHRSGYVGWWIVCCLFILREYQKAFFHVLSKKSNRYNKTLFFIEGF
ncbi:MAG: glycosyltransferase family 2 protein [Proteobacteria bacterium]|nr:glycosyltransferase family 2 protein [Pseudomonadota bacterium]